MDWKNVDLNSHFETLLLEVQCSIKKEDVNEQTVYRIFEDVLRMKVDDAKHVIKCNIKNIVNKTKQE